MKVLPMDFLGFPNENEFKYGEIRSIFSECHYITHYVIMQKRI